MVVLQVQVEARLLGAVRPGAPFGERDHAMLTLVLHTGLRVSELVGLDVADVAHQGQVRQQLEVRGKGGRSRSIPLNGTAREAIARLLAFNSRRGFSVAPERPLLVTRQHQRLGVRYVQRLMECLREQAQLGVVATPHTLRRTFATRVAEKMRDPYLVRALLGHQRLDTSSHYVQASPRRLAVAVAQLEPVKWELRQVLEAWPGRHSKFQEGSNQKT